MLFFDYLVLFVVPLEIHLVVQFLVDVDPEVQIAEFISRFFKQMKRDDLLLLYYSGHGVRDVQGNLYLAVKDTQKDYLKATAIPSRFIEEEMNSTYSKRQVLVLDCCHSGAFGRLSSYVWGSGLRPYI